MFDYIKLVAHNGKKDPHAILLMLPLPDADGTIKITDIINEGPIPLITSTDRDTHTLETLTTAGYPEVHEIAQVNVNLTEYKAWVAKMGKMKAKIVEPAAEV